jgi:hypothetical protein
MKYAEDLYLSKNKSIMKFNQYSLSISFILSIFLLIPGSIYGQNAPTQKTPKIGLVLSGGGAKGMAQVWVLRYT